MRDTAYEQSPFLTLHTSDLDELRAAYTRFNVEPVQLSRARFSGHLFRVDLGSMHVYQDWFNTGVHYRGAGPAGKYTYACLVSSLDPEPKWNGGRAGGRLALVKESGNEFVCRDGASTMTVVLDPSLIDEEFEQAPRRISDPYLLNQLKLYVQDVFRMGRERIDVLQREAMKRIVRDDLQTILSAAAEGEDRFQHMRETKRFDSVRRAVNYMHERIGDPEPLTLRQICAAVNVRPSTLIHGFNQYFGQAPLAYLKLCRLSAVKRALLSSDPRTTRVVDIAADYGFWHMGHFGMDYKATFGESPSLTLRKSA